MVKYRAFSLKNKQEEETLSDEGLFSLNFGGRAYTLRGVNSQSAL